MKNFQVYSGLRYVVMALLFSIPLGARAQFQGEVYKLFQDADVSQYGINLLSPWCGGINSIQVNHADLDNDGKKDLVLYDQNTEIIRTFLNTGVNGDVKYVYTPKYEVNFPYINYYMLLKDYNCDNIPDLFEKGLFGVSVHKGYYQNNELKFTFFKDLFFPGANGPVNVYVQPGDIPSIVDLDKDGDLDVLSYDVLGAQVALYINRRVEDALPCDSIKMTLADNCWGKFFQNIDRSVTMNIVCKGVSTSNKKTRHTGNCILHVDIEGDDDFDLLGGNVSFPDAQLLFNNGADVINAEDTTYNTNGHILAMPYWPSPFHVDVDNDGDHDILISSHSDYLNSANYNAVAWYRNLGTDANPNFVFLHDTLFTADMIDAGTYSYPTFFDYDKDGRKDLFVGSEGYLNNNTAQLQCKLAYYRNTSTPGNIAFELVTKDFLNLSSKNYKGIFPTFGDMTGDGVEDLVLGNVNGSVGVYKNFAPNNLVTPNFILFADSLANVTVGKYSMPVVFDYDQDGRTDLLVGNQAGYLAYFRDTSTAVNLKKLSLVNAQLGNFKAGDPFQLYGYCAPFIGKMDNTQHTFLMVGTVDGTIERYHQNFISNPNNFTRIDSNYSLIKTPSRAVPAVADLDGDGNFEMVTGNKLGGLRYYKQVMNVGLSSPGIGFSKNGMELYPNPVSETLQLNFTNPVSEQQAQIRIYDLAGRLVYDRSFNTKSELRFNIKHLAAGSYQVVVTLGQERFVKKISKL